MLTCGESPKSSGDLYEPNLLKISHTGGSLLKHVLARTQIADVQPNCQQHCRDQMQEKAEDDDPAEILRVVFQGTSITRMTSKRIVVFQGTPVLFRHARR